MLYLLLFLTLTGWGLAGSHIVRNACYGPVWGQSAVAVLLYVAALAGLLLPAALLLAMAGVLYTLYAAAWRGGWKTFDFRFIAGASSLAFLLALSNSTGMRFFAWDEFSHWGLQLKFLLHTHALQTDNLDLIFPNYIPGLSLYRYLGGLFDSSFEQGASLLNWYLAYMCLLAAATGLVDRTRNVTSWARATAVWFMGFFGYFLFFQALVATMYVDSLQSLLLLACFVAAPQMWRGARPLLAIAPLLVLIVLTKHVGIVLACMAIGLCAVASYAETGRLRASDLKRCAALLAICLMFWLSWRLHVDFHDLQAPWRLRIDNLSGDSHGVWAAFYGNVVGVLQGRFPHAQYFGEPLLPFSPGLLYMGCVMAGAGIVALGLWLASARPLRKAYGLMLAYLLLCLLAYLLLLAGIRGAAGWASDVWSFSRYYSALLFPCLFFLLIWFIRKQGGALAAWVMAAASAGACITLTAGVDELFRLQPRPLPAIRAAADALADEVRPLVPAQARTWYVYDADDGLRYYLTRYTLYPIRELPSIQTWHYFSREALSRPMDETNSPQAFAETLRQLDYVIVDAPNPEFWARYDYFFPDREHRVYKVVRSLDGEIRLQGM